MNIRKSLIAAALFMSVSAITFAQAPATKPAKKEKTEKAASDTTKAVKKAHHAPKKAA